MRHWREVWRVRFNQIAVGRTCLGDGLDFGSILERYDAGKREIATEVEPAARQLQPAGVTVKDEREGSPLPHGLLQRAGHVVVGRSRMNDERQPGLARGLDVLLEAPSLRRVVALVVIVEPGLADSHAAGMRAEADQLVGEDV
jgi:hypothetical protein